METIPKVLLGIVVAFSFCGGLLWRHFGSDICLPILADMTPVLLAVVGVIMSYIQPKKESHLITTIVLVIAGLLGTAVLSLNRIRSEDIHRAEIGDLNGKMDFVRNQNTNLSNFLLSSKNTGMSEADRRKGIETVLRNKYILTHDPIDPEILAGNQMPPQDWMNQELASMGEHWKVEEPKHSPNLPTIIQQAAPEPKQAQIAFSFWQPTLGPDNIATHLETHISNEVEVTITAINISDVPAENVNLWLRACASCAWISVPPELTQNDPDTPWDRIAFASEMLPNVALPRWKLRISAPVFPRASSIQIGGYYACKNCAPVDWKKPQVLLVSDPGLPLKLLTPSISYTPGRVPK
jgi:hypothetical protein